MDPSLQSLLDERAIHNLCVRYATALDNRDWNLLRSCFTTDAVTVYDGIGECSGYEAIEGLCRRALGPLTRTQHLVGNISAEVDGDTATAQCYLQAQHVRDETDGGAHFIIAGRYSDRLVRADDGWRIAWRRLETWWTEGNPAVVGA
jgi:3-phenylpropionate/cinnamic acid dioxygenase small subunit